MNTHRAAGARMEPLECRTLLAAGQIDRYFGVNGVADLTDIQDDQFVPPLSGMGIDSRGRIVTAASLRTGDRPFVPTVFRSLANGAPDTTFNPTGSMPGRVEIDAVFASEFGSDIALRLTADDRIVLLRTTAQPLLARLNADGSPDATFGSDGVVTFDQLHPGRFSIAPDGRILVVGSRGTSAPLEDAAAIRFNTDGSIDTTFGENGLVVLPQWTPSADVSGTSHLQDTVPLPDGKIAVGGTFSFNMNFGPDESGFPDIETITTARYSRLNADGTLDTTFGDHGITTSTHEASLRDLALAPDGTLVAAIEDDSLVSLASPGVLERIKLDGTIDTSFGGVGEVRAMDFPDPADIAEPVFDGFVIAGVVPQFDGKLIVFGDGERVGTGLRASPIALGRFNPDGTPDLTFGAAAGIGGTDTNDAAQGAFDDVSYSALAPDGSIVVLGIHQGMMRLARYWRDDAPAGQVGFKRNLPAPAAGSGPFKFAVSWRDDVGIDLTTIDSLDVRVDGPDGSRRKARPASIQRNDDGQVHVLYKFSAPGGTWDAADNGTYRIRIRAHEVADTAGHFAQARTIGTFSVGILSAARAPDGARPPTVGSTARRKPDALDVAAVVTLLD